MNVKPELLYPGTLLMVLISLNNEQNIAYLAYNSDSV